jgi:DNA-binding NarL/FixJ family response regulator
MDASLRIVIADDHPLFRGALRHAVAGRWPHAEIIEAQDFQETTAALGGKDTDTDLVLLDLAMPGMQGFSGIAYLRAQHPGVPVLVVSGTDDPVVVRRCLDFGSSGFLPKTQTVETMREAIGAVLDGGSWTPPEIAHAIGHADDPDQLAKKFASLTPQQMRVLMMLSEGLLNKQIAYHLDVSEATVKAHVSAILTKLDVDSRTQAVILAARFDPASAAQTMRA